MTTQRHPIPSDGYRDPSHADPAIVARVFGVAFALAETHFPVHHRDHGVVTTVTAAAFFLDGKHDTWNGHAELSDADELRLGRFLKHRMSPLAYEEKVRDIAARVCDNHTVAHYDLLADQEHLLPRHGRESRACADALLDELDTLRARQGHLSRTATPGAYTSVLRIPRAGATDPITIDTHYILADHQAPLIRPIHPHLTTAPALDELTWKVREHLDIAERLDTATEKPFREHTLTRLFDGMLTRQGPIGDHMVLRSGRTRLLQAPTGIGKSVLCRDLGTWAVETGVTLALVVPNNMDVLKVVHGIEHDLRALGHKHPEHLVTALMAPDGIMATLDRVAATHTDHDFIDWAHARLGYGCAMSAGALTDREVDTWVGGGEPCTSLVPDRVSTDGRRDRTPASKVCPYRDHDCDKYRLARAATRARVVVTSHGNFRKGSMHLPLLVDGTLRDNLTVEEFILRHCQLVVMDEIDAYQASALDDSARGFLLAGGESTHEMPLRTVDTEFAAAFGRVHTTVDESVRNTIARARWLPRPTSAIVPTIAWDPTSKRICPKRGGWARDRRRHAGWFPNAGTAGSPTTSVLCYATTPT